MCFARVVFPDDVAPLSSACQRACTLDSGAQGSETGPAGDEARGTTYPTPMATTRVGIASALI